MRLVKDLQTFKQRRGRHSYVVGIATVACDAAQGTDKAESVPGFMFSWDAAESHCAPLSWILCPGYVSTLSFRRLMFSFILCKASP